MTKRGKLFLTAIAGAAATYFSICCIFWILYLSGAFYNDPSQKIQLPAHQYLIALPCFFLTAVFWFATIQILRKQDSAKFVVFAGVILAAILCWYDISHQHYQASFYDKNGNGMVYMTWWFSGLFK